MCWRAMPNVTNRLFRAQAFFVDVALCTAAKKSISQASFSGVHDNMSKAEVRKLGNNEGDSSFTLFHIVK